MCVILDKNPGAEIPFEKLLAAASRNGDGYGVITIDRGKLEVIKNMNAQPGKNADDVAKLMESAKDCRQLIHFRMRTAGDVSIDNLHPFHVLNERDFGTDIWLMHNGTLSDFGSWSENESDTALFAKTIAGPLAYAVANVNGPESVLNDTLFKEIMRKYAGASNKFSFVDGKGTVLHINESAGLDYPWGWASNTYSLTHKPSQRDWDASGRKPVYVPPKPKAEPPKGMDDKCAMIVANASPLTVIQDYEPANRADICTVLDLNDITEVFCLDENNLQEIYKENLDVGILLTIDLMYALYQANKTIAELRHAANQSTKQ